MRQWRQIQAVVDRLLGREKIPLRAQDLDEPWRTVYGRLRPLGEGDVAERVLWKAAEGLDRRNQIVEQLLVLVPGADVYRQFRSLEEMSPELPPVEWLWPGWIPRGMLSLLGAAPGAGKSLIALDLARRMIHGGPFPDGSAVPAPGGNVVYVDAEAIPQIQHERARAWKMDLGRLYLMLPEESYGMIDLGAEGSQGTLVQMCNDLMPHLVVVDSLSSISARGENNVEDVRCILAFLSSLARDFDAAVLLIHHLRKRGKLEPAYDAVTSDDFRGSSHIIAVARSVLGLSMLQQGPEADRNGPRRLEVVKTNLGKYPAPLGVAFEPLDAHAPSLRYFRAPTAQHRPTQVEQCAAWLVALLREAEEPVKPRDAVRLAVESGFSRMTVYRARRELGKAIVDVGASPQDPAKRWSLLSPPLPGG